MIIKKIIFIFIFLGFLNPVLADDIEQVTIQQVQDIHIKILGGTPERQEKLQSLARRMIADGLMRISHVFRRRVRAALRVVDDTDRGLAVK